MLARSSPLERPGCSFLLEDEQALAAAISSLIDDPELRAELGRNARRTIVERFDSRIGAATLYESLFGTPPLRAEATRARSGRLSE